MNNKMKQEMDRIKIPDELHFRSKLGIKKAKSEIQNNQRYGSKMIVALVSLLIVLGSLIGYKNYIENSSNQQASPSNKEPFSTEVGSIYVPAIELPKNTENANMIGLIVYNGRIYTQTTTEIDAESAKDVLGEKLGTTKANIDEWSNSDKYDVEFASSIGKTDVYTVKGYDKAFRIMTYSENDGEINSELYECLNGITIHDGGDVFGKLKMTGTISSAQYRDFSDWNYNVDNYYPINDKDLLNSFVKELNHTSPHTREKIEDTLGDFRNDETYKEMIIHLIDGSKVSLVVIKGGYISYGYSDLYFKMDDEVFKEIWDQLNIR